MYYLSGAGALGATGVDTSIEVDTGYPGLKDFVVSPPVPSEVEDAIRASLRMLDVAPPHVAYPHLRSLSSRPWRVQ